MKDDKKHISYSTDYLLRYLRGELSPKETQALEKEALGDPFLSDAIDGLAEAAHHPSSLESDVTELKRRLSERVSEQKRNRNIFLLFPRWQVAASILVLAGLTTLTTIWIVNNNRQNRLSEVSRQITQKDSGHSEAPLALADSEKIEKMRAQGTAVYTDSNAIRKIENLEEAEKNVTAKAGVKAKERNTLPQAAPREDIPALSPEKTDPTADARPNNLKKLKQIDSLDYAPGLAVDRSERRIESDTVNVGNGNQAAVTDSNGYSDISPKNYGEYKDIAKNNAGVKPVGPVASDSSPGLSRTDSTTTELNEVVVTGYARQKKSDIAGSAAVVSGKSLGMAGMQALNDYVNKNKKILNADSTLKGEEVISFMASKSGELSSFKVIKSVSPSHDAEVIRLLKSGPKLQPAKKQKCQISVFFN